MSYRKYVSNALLTLTGYLFSAITLMFLSRTLGPDSYGRIAFAGSVISYFSLLAAMGIPTYAQRVSAGTAFKTDSTKNKEHSPEAKTIGEIFILSLFLAVLSYLFLIVTVRLVPRFRIDGYLMLILGISIIFSALQCAWYYRGIGAWQYLFITTTIFHAVQVILLVCFVRKPEDILLYGWLSLVYPTGCAVVNLLHLPMKLSGAMSLGLFCHFRQSLRFFLMSCMVNIYSQLDTVMLGFMKTNDEVGCYSVAARIKAVLTATGGVIWNVNLTEAVRLNEKQDRTGFEALLQKGMRMVCFIQIPVFFYSFFHSEYLVNFVAGDGYQAAVFPLRILLCVIPPVAVSNILGGQALIPSGLEKKLLLSETAGTCVNLVLNFLLIPEYSIDGAAIATVLAEVIVCLCTVYYVKRELSVRIFSWRYICKICALTGLALAASLLSGWTVRSIYGNQPLVILIITGSVFSLIYLGVYYLNRRTALLRRLSYMIQNIPNIGKERSFYCPCCQKYLYRFAAGSYMRSPEIYNTDRYRNTEQHVVCPYCGSIPRHRIIAQWAENHIDSLRKSRILYFAPERCMMMWMKRNQIPVTTADLYARADLKLDITDIDLPDSCYDYIFCNHVIEHVSDYRKALGELERVLSDQGILIICFPVDPAFPTVFEENAKTDDEWVRKFGQRDHRRVFGADSRQILEKAGFTVDRIDLGQMPDSILPIVGPADYDSNEIFLCRKEESRNVE